MESLASEQISSLRAAINSKSEDTDWRALADSWKEMNLNISTTRQGMENMLVTVQNTEQLLLRWLHIYESSVKESKSKE